MVECIRTKKNIALQLCISHTPPPPARPLSLGVRPGGRGLDLVLSSSEKARKGLAAKSDQPRSSMTEKVTASKGAIGSNPKSLKSQKLHRPAERTTSKR